MSWQEKLKFAFSDREWLMYGNRDCGAANKDRGAETWSNIPEGGGGGTLNANCVPGGSARQGTVQYLRYLSIVPDLRRRRGSWAFRSFSFPHLFHLEFCLTRQTDQRD